MNTEGEEVKRMKKGAVSSSMVVGIVIAVLIVGAGVVMMNTSQTTENQASQTPSTQTQPTESVETSPAVAGASDITSNTITVE